MRLGTTSCFRGGVTVGGTTTLAGVTVQADNPANDFVGSLALSGTAIGSIFDVNNLDLATSNFNFALSTTVQITANGNITQSGPLTATAPAGVAARRSRSNRTAARLH